MLAAEDFWKRKTAMIHRWYKLFMKHDGSPKTWLDMTIEYSWCVWHLSDSWLFAKRWSEFPFEACEKAWTSLSGQLMDFCKPNPLTILNLFLEYQFFRLLSAFLQIVWYVLGEILVISSHRSRSSIILLSKASWTGEASGRGHLQEQDW